MFHLGKLRYLDWRWTLYESYVDMSGSGIILRNLYGWQHVYLVTRIAISSVFACKVGLVRMMFSGVRIAFETSILRHRIL